ncbi:basic proline-rich protein-like isoform X2 [Choloepus didactylus]|uniref:basic proline-rich protein-like isoform X2 n=1 Tax=Choloepus didactylus TaxID=27675 RepID=UPI00189CECA3|nr:basic proline-rich protein-like isoform X2 [Choloepus didactylus]
MGWPERAPASPCHAGRPAPRPLGPSPLQAQDPGAFPLAAPAPPPLPGPPAAGSGGRELRVFQPQAQGFPSQAPESQNPRLALMDVEGPGPGGKAALLASPSPCLVPQSTRLTGPWPGEEKELVTRPGLGFSHHPEWQHSAPLTSAES